MKSKLISLRIEEEIEKKIIDISNIENIDKSIIYRQSIKKGMLEIKKELAIKLFVEEKYTLSSAAKFAEMYIGDFITLLSKRGITQDISLETYLQGNENAKEVFKNLKIANPKKKIKYN
ncbi:MAG: UPF0175 family protein [Candidatus ainarchaeum sp.]|jgi:hypothetical protein|nr:UPF0175 family protein [Candidatus ainarchaeum sp.]